MLAVTLGDLNLLTVRFWPYMLLATLVGLCRVTGVGPAPGINGWVGRLFERFEQAICIRKLGGAHWQFPVPSLKPPDPRGDVVDRPDQIAEQPVCGTDLANRFVRRNAASRFGKLRVKIADAVEGFALARASSILRTLGTGAVDPRRTKSSARPG